MCKKLPYEEFSGVDKDKEIAKKVKIKINMELVRIYFKLFNKIAITTNFLAFFQCFFPKHCPPGSGSTERKINADQDDDPDLQTT